MEILTKNGDVVTIDDEDVGVIDGTRWRSYAYSPTLRYAVRGSGATLEYMHRLIMSAAPGTYVDHKDGDGMNNRKENLRITSQGVNVANSKMFSSNTTGYRGVIVYRTGWRAQIKFNGRNMQSFQLPSPYTAALVRDELARRLFGELTFLNFPDAVPSSDIVNEVTRVLSRYPELS